MHSTIDEVRNIMDILGRGSLEGEVKGMHLSTILSYLRETKTEPIRKTLSKLTIKCGTGRRYIRENYLEGLIEYGIIEIERDSREMVWHWVGEKAFSGDGKK